MPGEPLISSDGRPNVDAGGAPYVYQAGACACCGTPGPCGCIASKSPAVVFSGLVSNIATCGIAGPCATPAVGSERLRILTAIPAATISMAGCQGGRNNVGSFDYATWNSSFNGGTGTLCVNTNCACDPACPGSCVGIAPTAGTFSHSLLAQTYLNGGGQFIAYLLLRAFVSVGYPVGGLSGMSAFVGYKEVGIGTTANNAFQAFVCSGSLVFDNELVCCASLQCFNNPYTTRSKFAHAVPPLGVLAGANADSYFAGGQGTVTFS